MTSNSIETSTTGSNPDSNKHRFEIIQDAQMELISRAGGELQRVAMDWITANSKRFRELIEDPQNNFVERLSSENTRDEALLEIQKKLAN